MDTVQGVEVVLDKGSYKITRLGLVFTREHRFEEYELIGATLAKTKESVAWAIGDWIICGEKFFSERFSQMLDNVGLELHTIQNHKWCCSKFTADRRREELTYTHHYEVAGLDSILLQDQLLQRAIDEKLSSVDLRRIVKEMKGADKDPDGSKPDQLGKDPMETARKAFLALESYQREEFVTWAHGEINT